MARWLYSLVYTIALPLIVMRLVLRSLKAPGYRRRVAERFGLFTVPSLRDPIWIHAVSVGETIAAEPIVRRLQHLYPHRDIVITTMTPTGSERVRALFGDTVFHVYAPYDAPFCVRLFLNRVRPTAFLIMETELWPNILYHCRRRGIPSILVNARLSAKSAIGYQNVALISRPMLKQLTAVIAQTEEDANRFQTLGVAADNLYVSGSVKFDVTLSESMQAQAGELRRAWQGPARRKIWIAASTHAGEDEILLRVQQSLCQTFPDLLLVLVPRHPERFGPVAAQAEKGGLVVALRSSGQDVGPEIQVLVGDTMGELLLLYGVADICFVGGSLVPRGGHNTLEPAAWGRPIITGMSDFNFAVISEKLCEAGALVKVADESALVQQLLQWMEQPESMRFAGRAAQQVVNRNRGVLDRVVSILQRWLD